MPSGDSQPPYPGNNADLIEALDEKTRILSGGFEHLEEFERLYAQGEAVLPELLETFSSPDWWKLQLVWTIAHDIGKTIPFSPEQAGRHDEVVKAVTSWAIENGYVIEERA